jgi:hypothetical protein
MPCTIHRTKKGSDFMPAIDAMGKENAKHGICGFTSTLYAVHDSRPALHEGLDRALDKETRRIRTMAEIKTFLEIMRGTGKATVLADITELTRTFPGYGSWTIESYIEKIDNFDTGDYSIAMPPESTMEYMRTAWDMRPVLTDQVIPGDVILGLTRTGAPVNRWKNLAHYVYQSAAGRIYSWGKQFDSMEDVNTKRDRDYSVVYRIMVHG